MKTISLKDKKVTIFAILFCLWAAIGILLIFSAVKFRSSNSAELSETVSGDAVQETLSRADESLQGIYSALLSGSDFQVDDNMFSFGSDGKYDGYFDADDTDVAGYNYEVTRNDDGQYILAIHNDNKTKYTEYVMSFGNDGSIILTYPGMNASITLSY